MTRARLREVLSSATGLDDSVAQARRILLEGTTRSDLNALIMETATVTREALIKTGKDASDLFARDGARAVADARP